MKKPGIETKVSVFAVIIVIAVVLSGFLVYRSLTEIVSSIQNEASPDYRLIIIKDIALDLLEIENNIQLYALTRNRTNLKNYEKINERLKGRVDMLVNFSKEQNDMAIWNDSIKQLVISKLDIWEEIKQIHTIKTDPQPQFEELYSMLEKKEIDTVEVAIAVFPEKKKGILKRIFSKKDTVTTVIDTTFVEKSVENEEIRDEIQQLEAELKQKEQRKNRRELLLLEQNIQVTGKINKLIAKIEEAEKVKLIEKTDNADRLATIIYKRLSAFSIMSVVLLFVVLYLFVRYLQKSKIYQRVLTKAKHEAERLAGVKEVFIANVSHEMRTPVNAIYGLTEQVMQHNLSANVKKQLAIVLKSAQHLKEVVSDTLDFSKIQANKLKLEEIHFSPESSIEEILNMHKTEAASKNIDLFYKKGNKLPTALLGDPFRLKQILINTLGNAIKFTESGSVTLTVKLMEQKKEQIQLHFLVEDTGIGISEENLKLIFEDFIQVESNYTRKFSGTGLGLSIVKKLIELQNGEISIESELNKGTRVSFYIPYHLGNSDSVEQLDTKEILIPDKFRELTFLVVDDEEFNRYLLKVIFEKWGVKFQEAQNGEEAVKMSLENNYEVILMDLRMPVLNGIEASKQIIAEKSDSKIIAVAAVNSESETKLCKEAGISDFLSKPFSEVDLLNTLISVLEIDIEKDAETGQDFELIELERLANGDKIFLKEMVRIFIRSTQNEIKNIKQALEEKNWQGISDSAHKMAAPCKHLMATDLYNKIKQLENYTTNLKSLSLVPELVSSIGQKTKKINKELSVLIDSGRFDD